MVKVLNLFTIGNFNYMNLFQMRTIINFVTEKKGLIDVFKEP